MCAAPFVGPLSPIAFRASASSSLGAVFWSGLTLLTAFTHNYNELLVRHTLVGIGEATFVTIVSHLRRRLVPGEKRGRMLGIVLSGHPGRNGAGISARRQHGARLRMAFSFLHRSGSRLSAGVIAALHSGAETRSIRFARKQAPRAGHAEKPVAQSCFPDSHSGHGDDDICTGRHPGLDAHFSVPCSRLHLATGECHFWGQHSLSTAWSLRWRAAGWPIGCCRRMKSLTI